MPQSPVRLLKQFWSFDHILEKPLGNLYLGALSVDGRVPSKNRFERHRADKKLFRNRTKTEFD